MPIDPKRGEIWRVELNPTRGAEMQKTRPVIVLSPAGVGAVPCASSRPSSAENRITLPPRG